MNDDPAVAPSEEPAAIDIVEEFVESPQKSPTADDSDKLSITDLINLDNISSHNLYLGQELRRFGATSSSLIEGSDGDMSTFDDASSDIVSTDSSRVSPDSTSPVEIDYSALDRFGFIVLGEENSIQVSSEEHLKIREKQYFSLIIIIRSYLFVGIRRI